MNQPLAQEREPAAATVRVATWNLQSCVRGLPGIASLLRALPDVDLIALQEVDRATARSGGLDQAAWLAREAGFAHVRFFPALPWAGGGEYGLALLARHPLAEPRREALPCPPGAEPRVLGAARLELPGGPLAVHVTHLSHRVRAFAARLAQARVICRLLEAVPGPSLLLGDLNDLPFSPMYRALRGRMVDVFARAGEGPGGTHPLAPLPLAARIDYLFASREFVPEQARVIPTRASDHHLLVARLRLPPAAPALAVAGGREG